MASITWLHLSDLHACNPVNGWDSNWILDALLPDLRHMEDAHGLHPDLIFFTGDAALGQIGSAPGLCLADQFAQAGDFLDGVRRAFHPQVCRTNLFLVPGNHDVDRGEVDPGQTAWLDGLHDPDVVHDVISRAGPQWRRYMERLRHYSEFLARSRYDHLRGDPQRLMYAAVRGGAHSEGHKIGIAGLNTAWSCGRDAEIDRLWSAGEWQIGVLHPTLRGCTLSIVLTHHPIDWFARPERGAVLRRVTQGFQFHLHGHEHQEWVDPREGHIRVAAGACYQREGKPGYNFVRVNLESGQGEVWLREYDRQTNCWGPAVVAGRAENGVWPFRLPLGPDPSGPTSGGAAARASLSRLPTTDTPFLGREEELDLLNHAWEDPGVHIVTVVSLAGAGKTALVRHWQQRMEQSGYRGAERVFAWSFYTERTRTDAGTPGDEFVHAALRWFGDPDPRDGSPWDKGVRLANLVRAQRSLLILDSLEPLQEPPTAARAGEIRDEAVATLVRELAVANSGLCLITTRTPVLDIAAYERSTAPSLTLRPLPDEEGAALLAALGVHGTEDERRSTSRWVLGHGLSLALLGRYVGRACNGAITGPTQALLQQAIQHEGGPVRGIVQEYERWLDEPSLAILRLLGLFDGPASQASLRALRASPPIAGLTEPLVDLEDSGWWIAVRQLLECGLASPGPGGDHALDLHPLIREHLAQDLPTRSTQAWREGNERLYRHFRDTSEDRPKSLEGMIPLFNAVTHGCRAGLHEECWTEVFWPRICREGREYLVNALGAVSAELAMLSRFLSEPCPTAAHDLRPAHRAWALVHAGLAHRHLGNMRDAEAAMVAGREVHEREGDSNGLTNACRHLGQLYCIMGRLNQALQSAREGVEAASQGCTRLEEIAAKATLAHIYLQRGDMRDAGQSFAAALETQKGAGLLPIFWLPEYRYCDFLLSEGRPSDALRIADLANGPHQRPAFRMGYYLGLLTMARARILLAQQGGPNDLSQAWDEVGQAVDGLREWGQQELLVPAFLTRAALLRIMRSYDRAHHDLSAATDIVTRGGMRLYEADCCLETARLRCAAGHQDAAKDLRRQASAMVDEMGYHRRDGEIADLQADLRITDPPR